MASFEIRKGDLVVVLSMPENPYYKVGKSTKLVMSDNSIPTIPSGAYLDLSTFSAVTPYGKLELDATADGVLTLNYGKAIIDSEGNLYCQLATN